MAKLLLLYTYMPVVDYEMNSEERLRKRRELYTRRMAAEMSERMEIK